MFDSVEAFLTLEEDLEKDLSYNIKNSIFPSESMLDDHSNSQQLTLTHVSPPMFISDNNPTDPKLSGINY
jgi:hypothetical protein